MDIVGKEGLETMLMNYEGTVLFVSHDRYFVQKIADSLLVFEKGQVNYYPFGYQEYTERRLTQTAEEEPVPPTVRTNSLKAVPTGKRPDRKAQSKKEQEIRKLELLVEETEREIGRIKTLMEAPELACDYAKLSEMNDQLNREERKHEEYLENYVRCCEEMGI
jgi:ATP-binding cassette subfamily F protein 3